MSSAKGISTLHFESKEYQVVYNMMCKWWLHMLPMASRPQNCTDGHIYLMQVPVRAVAWQSLADILQQASGPDSSGSALSRPARRAVLATFLQHCRLPDPHVELHRRWSCVHFLEAYRILVWEG